MIVVFAAGFTSDFVTGAGSTFFSGSDFRLFLSTLSELDLLGGVGDFSSHDTFSLNPDPNRNPNPNPSQTPTLTLTLTMTLQ